MKASVICSAGIGDALMMLIASYQLTKKGYCVTTFTDHHMTLSALFPYTQFAPLPSRSEMDDTLCSFDLFIFQRGIKSLGYDLHAFFYKKKVTNCFIFHPTFSPNWSSPKNCIDKIFDPRKPMTHNISESIATILNQEYSLNNGIVIPSNLMRRKYKKRILIHPTSSCLTRTWSQSKFLAVAKGLKQAGFDPVFCVSPSERAAWVNLTKKKFLVPYFPTLKELVPFVYESSFLIGNESGTGHLASNLGLPTLIIAKCPKQMLLWRPGWHPGRVLTPSPIIPNIKGMRLKKKFWKAWVSPKKVLQIFFDMINQPSDL